MKIKSTLALILPALVAFSCTAMAATVFQLDFSTRGGSQSGWETVGTNTTGTLNGSFSGYTGLSASNITVNVTNIAFNRNYGNSDALVTDFPGTGLDAMYRDLVFRNNTGTATIDITIGGLLAGTYTITTHHLHEGGSVTPSRFNLTAQDADSPSFGQSAAADIAMGLGTATSFSPTVITFDVVSNGTDPVILRMKDTFIGSGGNTGGWWGINGLEIVPEPSTALLGAIGLLALLRRRR